MKTDKEIAMNDAAAQTIRENFGKVWPAHVSSLIEFLIKARSAFGGDLDLFLVLAVIGDRTFAAGRVSPSMTFDDFMSEERANTEPFSVNAYSISQFSRIPRETVRRKVQELVNIGWVQRNGDGSLQATRKAAVDLLPLTEASVTYLARMSSLFRDAADT
ncbi:MAG: hypothetical protein K2Q28_09370 [Hyphomicrobium sp.]|nr:hypothetical protein [Hyphomicrobium sp.]